MYLQNALSVSLFAGGAFPFDSQHQGAKDCMVGRKLQSALLALMRQDSLVLPHPCALFHLCGADWFVAQAWKQRQAQTDFQIPGLLAKQRKTTRKKHGKQSRYLSLFDIYQCPHAKHLLRYTPDISLYSGLPPLTFSCEAMDACRVEELPTYNIAIDGIMGSLVRSRYFCLISIYASSLCVRVLIWHNWLSTAMYNSESMKLYQVLSKCFQHQNLEALEWGKVGVGMNEWNWWLHHWLSSK